MNDTRPVPVEKFLLRAVGRTDVGAQRTQNEDAMYYDDFLGVYVVCDGMGGHASGQVASDIAIRTIVLKNGGASVQAGAGIVADSVPEREYEETVHKARALLRAIEIAEEGN